MNLRAGIAERYGLALVLLLVALVYAIATPEGEWLRVGTMLLQGIAVFATLSAAETDRRILKGFLAILLLAVVGAIFQAGFTEDPTRATCASAFSLVILASLPLVSMGLVRQVRADRKITVQTMMGVLCAYLLLALSFAYAFAVIGEVGSEPFFSQGEKWNTIGDYIYFSLITITTVGFGDFTPGTDLGRSLTAAEALIGQIYMVTVVAVIVANLGRSDPGPVPSGEQGSDEARDDGTT